MFKKFSWKYIQHIFYRQIIYHNSVNNTVKDSKALNYEHFHNNVKYNTPVNRI